MSAKRTKGRPAYEPTDEDREKVRILRASGMSMPAISEAMDIAEPTLRKYFSLDLEIAQAKVTADVMIARYRAAMAGNVQAQNRLLEQLGAVPRKPEARPRKLGKKEQTLIDLQTAHIGTEWEELVSRARALA